MNFSADFEPGQAVRIKALEREARVLLVRFDGYATDYYVSWWDEGKRYSEWLPRWDLA